VTAWFREAGLSVEVQDGRGSGNTLQLVNAGQADVGQIQVGLIAQAREQGATVRAFAGFGRRPVIALADVALSVREGEFLSLLGPSGCGKSTLLRAIAGLDPLTAGAITLRGVPIDRPPAGMGMVFQRDVLLDWRSIRDNVLLAAEFQGLPKRAYEAGAIALLERFGLGSFADRHPWELSGGMITTILVVMNSLPKVALAPLFVIWMGTGAEPKIAIAVMLAIFSIVADVALGLRSVDPDALALARVHRASGWRILWKVRFPNALPALFVGMKVAISFALVGAIVGEFVGGSGKAKSDGALRPRPGGTRDPRCRASLRCLARPSCRAARRISRSMARKSGPGWHNSPAAALAAQNPLAEKPVAPSQPPSITFTSQLRHSTRMEETWQGH